MDNEKVNKKKNERYSTIENLCYVLQGCKKWQPFLLVCMVLQAVTQGISIYVWIYGAKLVIHQIEVNGTTEVAFSNITWIIVIAALTEAVLMMIASLTNKYSESQMLDVRFSFIRMWQKKIMNMAYVEMENPKVLDARRKSIWALGDMQNGIEGIQQKTNVLAVNLVSMTVAFVLLLSLNPILVVILLVLSYIRFHFIDEAAEWEKIEARDKIMTYHRKSYYFIDVMSNFDYAKDIRLFRMEKPLLQTLKEITNVILGRIGAALDKWRAAYIKSYIVELLQNGLMYGWLIYAVLKKGMSIADFTLYLGSIQSFTVSIGLVLEQWARMKIDSRLVEDYRNFMEYPEEKCLKDTYDELEKSSFQKDDTAWGYEKNQNVHNNPIESKEDTYTFEFKNVSFRYLGSSTYALKHLKLTLVAGKRLAVVGLNGAGKSTFIKLLCRLYEPTEGVITMNGVDIRTYDRKEYFRMIAPVFQEVETFACSILENVSMHPDKETNRERVIDCIKKAGLENDVKAMPKGVDTELWKILHDDGIDLSGGQKQKLTLARALYKDAPIVILDEPTAALDALAEYESYMNFDRLIGGKTAIYISHRLSSTKFCHAIAMFAHGEMIEYGTHEQLMEKNGAYKAMFDVQAQYYRERGDNNDQEN